MRRCRGVFWTPCMLQRITSNTISHGSTCYTSWNTYWRRSDFWGWCCVGIRVIITGLTSCLASSESATRDDLITLMLLLQRTQLLCLVSRTISWITVGIAESSRYSRSSGESKESCHRALSKVLPLYEDLFMGWHLWDKRSTFVKHPMTEDRWKYPVSRRMWCLGESVSSSWRRRRIHLRAQRASPSSLCWICWGGRNESWKKNMVNSNRCLSNFAPRKCSRKQTVPSALF